MPQGLGFRVPGVEGSSDPIVIVLVTQYLGLSPGPSMATIGCEVPVLIGLRLPLTPGRV